jgi:phospholipid/cholesterol/gamma-HCH transport system substrate-binding protein
MKRPTEALVGASILLGILVVFFGTVWLKGTAFGREEVTIEARFTEVGQILKGNAVVLRGVRIGRVEDIYLEPGGEAVVVSMRITRDVLLPPDPVVLLSPKSMFGDWQAEIQPRLQFLRYDYAESGNPAILPGYSLPDISRLTAVADRIAENLAVVTERVEIAFTEETALNVRRAIENIEEVSAQLTGLVSTQQRTLDELASNLGATTVTLGDAAESVRRAFLQVESAVAEGELAAIVLNVHRSMARVDTLSAALLGASESIRAVMLAADSSLRSFQTITTDLGQGHGTLGRLLQDTAFYSELLHTNNQLQQLLEDMKQNPRKYINLRLF